MKHIPIFNTGISGSVLILGTEPYGNLIEEKTAFRLLDHFLAAGGNQLDTAPLYGHSKSEKTLGHYFKNSSKRSQFVLSSKCGFRRKGRGIPYGVLTLDEMHQEVEESLKRLHSDNIDILWAHRDDANLTVAEIVENFEILRKQGKIRAYGVSNWPTARLKEAVDYTKAKGYNSFAGDQSFLNAACHNGEEILKHDSVGIPDNDRIAYHKASGLPYYAWGSQAYGLFAKLEEGTGDSVKHPEYFRMPETKKRFALLQETAAKYQLSVTAASLQYLLSQPFPVFPIIGSANTAQLADSMQAAGAPKLLQEELSALDAIC
jgi:aryl-alcohol dehydrogenase-like predicted oxidoreductase